MVWDQLRPGENHGIVRARARAYRPLLAKVGSSDFFPKPWANRVVGSGRGWCFQGSSNTSDECREQMRLTGLIRDRCRENLDA